MGDAGRRRFGALPCRPRPLGGRGMTWDEKLGRIIREFFSGLTGRMEAVDDWERAKNEAWDQEEREARARSSAELHEELEDRRARREQDRGA